MLVTLRRAIWLIHPRWRRRWCLLVPLAISAAGLEMVGAGAVYVLIRLITDPYAVESIAWLMPLADWFGARDSSALTALVAVLLALLFIVKNGTRFVEALARQYCAEGTSVDLSTRLTDAYLRSPPAFHLRRNSAELIRNVQYTARGVATTTLHAASIVATEILIGIGVVAVLLWLTPATSLVLVVGSIALGAVLLWSVHGASSTWGSQLHQLRGEELRGLQHGLGHVKEVTMFDRATYFVERHRDVNRRAVWIEILQGSFYFVPRLVLESVFVLALSAMVVWSSLSSDQPWRLAPTISVFAYAALRLMPSFQLIVYHLSRLRFSTAGVDEIYADLQRLERIVAERAAQSATDAGKPFSDGVVFHHVSYVYEGSERPALRDIDLTIRRGESVGVVGATGAGKRPLILVLLGLLDPTSGSVRIDGEDLRTRRRHWQSQIGYVPQDVSLLDASLRANIAFARPEDEIDSSRVDEVVRIAQLERFVESLPDRLDTLVGERGVRLSGGERQRVAVARALYHDPEVLVFDEATSSLDSQTERALTETVERLHGRKTMVVIAHRLSTVRGCDRLVVLEEGRIVAVGSYDELCLRSEAFQALLAASADNAAAAHES